jgi:hypothetical protein
VHFKGQQRVYAGPARLGYWLYLHNDYPERYRELWGILPIKAKIHKYFAVTDHLLSLPLEYW